MYEICSKLITINDIYERLLLEPIETYLGQCLISVINFFEKIVNDEMLDATLNKPLAQSTFTCSKSTKEALGKGVKYVQSQL